MSKLHCKSQFLSFQSHRASVVHPTPANLTNPTLPTLTPENDRSFSSYKTSMLPLLTNKSSQGLKTATFLTNGIRGSSKILKHLVFSGLRQDVEINSTESNDKLRSKERTGKGLVKTERILLIR